MARVIPGELNPINLKRRGIYTSRFGSTTYFYRTKATKPDKYKPRKITDFTPRREKMFLCNQFWSNLPPCKKEAFASIIDESQGVTAYQLFLVVCQNSEARTLEEYIKEFHARNRCWCIHPRDQALNPYHTSSCLYLQVNKVPLIKYLPKRYYKTVDKLEITDESYIRYTYNKCIPHVDFTQSPDGWRSHWGGLRVFPETKVLDWNDKLQEYVPHFYLDKFSLKTDIGIGIYKPDNVTYRTGFDGYPEYNVNWIPIEFERKSFPYDHYYPWDRERILYIPAGTVVPDPEHYNEFIARFTPPEHDVTLCKSNQIEVHIAYKHDHVLWYATGGSRDPYFKIILWGQPVAFLGTGGGKIATAAGEIKNPTESRIVPMSSKTIDQSVDNQDLWQTYGQILEAKKVHESPKYIEIGGEEWLTEIQYIFQFPEPVHFRGLDKYPTMRVDARLPTSYYHKNANTRQWNYYPAKVSIYPGYDPYWWYWTYDGFGPLLEKDIKAYCFRYDGYWNSKRDWILVRYTTTRTPLFPNPFKGGGVDSIKVLVIKCYGQDMGYNVDNLVRCIEEHKKPPPPPPKE